MKVVAMTLNSYFGCQTASFSIFPQMDLKNDLLLQLSLLIFKMIDYST